MAQDLIICKREAIPNWCRNINRNVHDRLVTAGLEMRVRDGGRMEHYDGKGLDCSMRIYRAIRVTIN